MYNIAKHNKNQFLSDYDLINKYNIKNIFEKPSFNKIHLSFSLNSFSNACQFLKINDKNIESKIKGFFIFYFLFSLFPFINNNISKQILIEKNNLKENINYSIKCLLNNNCKINNFIHFLFVENWNAIEKENTQKIFFKNKSKNSMSNFKNNKLDALVCLPAKILYDFDKIVDNSLFDIISKNFNLNIKISFNCFNPFFKEFNHQNFIKNMPLFWLIK